MPFLDWVNKHQATQSSQKVPDRLLRQVSTGGDADGPHADNLLIKGDYLLALKALLPFYRGHVKCIFIDPPYNTQSAFEHYGDRLEHSQCLSITYPRLLLLRELLAENLIKLAVLANLYRSVENYAQRITQIDTPGSGDLREGMGHEEFSLRPFAVMQGNGGLAPAWQVQTVLAHFQQSGEIDLPKQTHSLPTELADGYLEKTQWLQNDQATLSVDLNGDGLFSAGEWVNLQGAGQAANDDYMKSAA